MLSGKSRKMLNWMMLALESNRVIGLRLAKLMRGGKAARREAERMVSEKMQAAAKAGISLMAGASSDEIVRQYRKRVAANAKRLGRQQRRRRKRNLLDLLDQQAAVQVGQMAIAVATSRMGLTRG